jgi:N-acetylneuraminic acid mutarotase
VTDLRQLHAGLLVVAVVASCLLAPADARAADDAWELVANIGVGRASAAVAAVDGMVYVIGGRANGVLKTAAVENSVEVYDPAANTWTALAPKPTGVVNDEAGVIGGIIYVPGGGVLEAYNPATNTWLTRAAMPAVVSSGTVAVVGNRLYVLGGKVEGVVGGGCYVYDQPSNTWSTCAPMTYARQSAGVGVIEGKIYVYGGDAGSFYSTSRDLERYDPSNNTWTTLAHSGGSGWTGVGVVGYGGLLYVCGGAYRQFSPIPPGYTDTRSNACSTYDPGTDTWAPYGTMLWTRANHGLVEAGGRLYATGGDSHTYMVHTTSERSPLLPERRWPRR